MPSDRNLRRRSRSSFALFLALGMAPGMLACHAPDPKQELEVKGLETYWAIDSASGDTKYLAPVARLVLHNRAARPQKSIQANAVFRRKGEETQSWGSDFQQVSTPRKPLGVGQDTVVIMKSDARYYSTGAPEQMFKHQLFRDARVDVFVRVGASPWTKLAQADVEDRIGSRLVPADVR